MIKEVICLNTQQLVHDNIKYNKEERQRLSKFIESNLKGHQVITNQTAVYYDQLLELDNVI